jgi:hypothetical protein
MPPDVARGARSLVAAMVLLCGASSFAQDKPVTFVDAASVQPLADIDAQALARYVGERLHESKALTPLSPALKADASPRVVFVSVSDGEQSAYVAISATRGAVRAADGAVAKLAKQLPDVAQRTWIKVDLVTRVEPLPLGTTNLALGINPSIEGLDLAGGIALLPEELQGWHIVDGGRLVEGSLYDYLDARPNRAAAPHGDAELRAARKFNTASSFVLDDGTPVPLTRGHRAFDTVSPDDLRAAADAAAGFLVRSVTETGKFDYSYRLDLDEVPREYDIVRHAGAIWAMIDYYRESKDADVMAAIERAMRYLLAQVRPMKIGGNDVLVAVEDDAVSLGGNALTALALANYIDVTGKREHLPILRGLGKGLRAAQSSSGRFVIQRQRFSSGAVFAEESPYYPGEAALAMLRIDDVEKDDALVDAAARATKYLITVRDAGKAPEELEHDHWLLYTLPAINAKRPDRMYVEHGAKMARAIVAAQHQRGSAKVPPDAVGSWMDARATPAAVRSEGLLATARLMRSAGRKDEADAFVDAARAGIGFQLRTQVWPEAAMHFRNPRRAIGGFRDELGGVYVRIDYVQHNLSSILALMHATSGDGAKTPAR